MIAERLEEIKSRIRHASGRSKRNPSEIEWVLVTKEVEPSRIKEAYDLGVRDFGENKVQELLSKRPVLAPDIRWHFIGHLQTNKVKFLVGEVVLIHSLDRMELAQAIQKEAEKNSKTQSVLIQVNASGENTKFGFKPEGVEEAVSQMLVSCDRLCLLGLMTIGPNTSDQVKVRASFHQLYELRENLKRRFTQCNWRYLSMGMSADFEIAVEEGANLLRLGTAVFGPRGK